GVVRRDIKPQTLRLTRDGNTLGTDSGTARALAGDEHRTHTGIAIGTPPYMSPEQASGEKTIGARIDRLLPARLLRTHVGRRADGYAGVGAVLVPGQGPRGSGVGPQRVAVPREPQGLRLDVPSDHA